MTTDEPETGMQDGGRAHANPRGSPSVQIIDQPILKLLADPHAN